MRIKFCGAARTVTGSQHLIDINGKKILLDCGLFQGKREEAYKINRHFLFDPADVDCVILSHAHIDHSGNLPTLGLKGFDGDIYSTTATRDLCSLMLLDSAHIQMRDVEYVNKKRQRNKEQLFNPLYGFEDVRKVMSQFKAVSYRKNFYLNGFGDNVNVTFFDAGHILGSAQVRLEIKTGRNTLRLGFTGDVGRKKVPILRDPEFMGNTDFMISESTYGGKVHDPAEEMHSQLESVIKEAAARGGKIIVPAFSVGRTQEIVFSLSKLFSKGSIPKIPIFVDSPLSANISDIFRIHNECFDSETSGLLSMGVDVFGFNNLTYIRDVEESKQLNDLKGCAMIISASGMCEGGRVLHHLKNNIEDPASTVLIVGYMAPDTLGRRFVEAKDTSNYKVRIFGEEQIVRAKIYVLNSFSAHADKNELVEYFRNFKTGEMKGVFLVHGDPAMQEALISSLSGIGFENVINPDKGDELDL